MTQERKIYSIEFTAIILLWTLVVISPLLFMDDLSQKWRAVQVFWTECGVVGFAFLVNRFVLMPYLFFAKRYRLYIISLSALLLSLGLFVIYFDGVNAILSLFSDGDIEAAMPPHNIPPQHPPHGGAMQGMPPANRPPSLSVIPPSITVMILSVITIALDMGLRIAVTWMITEQKQTTINRDQIAAQLQNLQSQVSPHFFMNTLNNIHALVDIDSQRAKQTIIELSELMDYLLYGSSHQEYISLHREIEFINSYVNLMRLRFSKSVKIRFSYSDEIPSVKIPPLLFLNFIENAFKYGVDYDSDSFVKIHLDIKEHEVRMTALNSNHSKSVKSARHGLGISNSRQRLDLLYGDRYALEIVDNDKIYYVTLKIPIL